jgi:TetR/AcrR family transcriptional repressor of mexJK operon
METDNATRIKKAAIKVFSQKGYKEAKITNIAYEAGISVGTIYANFKGKRELFNSLNLPEFKDYRPEYDKRREDILKTALSVFKRKGYNLTSMDDIASECGFTKAVLYQYFSGKEELFTAIFEEAAIISDFDHLAIENTNEDLEEVMMEAGYKFMRQFEDEGRLNLLRIVIAESGRFPDLGRIMYDHGINKVAEKFSAYLQILSDKGKIQCENPKLTGRSYFGLLYSFVTTDKIINPGNDEFSMDEIIEYAVKTFMCSLMGDSK